MRVLDVCCGAGGCSVGYARAGFEVVGVDTKPQWRYPFTMVREDLRIVLRRHKLLRRKFSLVHVSPPCQAYSDLQYRSGKLYPSLVPVARSLLQELGLPYVIENVEGAELKNPTVLCGTMFPGLRVLRHRLFETSFPVEPLEHPPHPLVFTHDSRKNHHTKLDQNKSFVSVNGGGNCTVANARDAMGIDWMIKRELNDAVPPAYTEYIGREFARATA